MGAKFTTPLMTVLKKSLSLIAVFAGLASLLLVALPAEADFGSSPDCGFFTGTTRRYGAGQMLFDYYGNRNRVCIDYSGYVDSAATQGLSYHSSLGKLKWSWGAPEDMPYVDLETGLLHGYVRIDSLLPQVKAGTLPANEMWIWLDWALQGAGGAPASHKAKVDLNTGQLSGFAWSDYLKRTTGNGYILLGRDASVELPPTQVQLVVDIVAPGDENGDLAYDTDYTVDEVNRDTAPLADGAQFWRVRIRAYDTVGSRSLDSSEVTISNVYVNETADSNIYLDQVSNISMAPAVVEETDENKFLDCSDGGAGSTCELTEWDGTGDTSFNRFVYSASPTSNMLYMKKDGVTYMTDRDGCSWIHQDNWALKMKVASQPDCPKFSGSYFTKEDSFYSRTSDRNKYEIDSVSFQFAMADGSSFELVDDGTVECIGGQCSIDFTGESLKFAPRFRLESLMAEYGGNFYSQISEDESLDQTLHPEASVKDLSQEYRAKHAMSSFAKIGFLVDYQMDITSDVMPMGATAKRLLMDVDGDAVEEHSYYTDAVPGSQFNQAYIRDFDIGYGQDEKACGMLGCDASTNNVSDPTAEMWVCDKIAERDQGGDSCYFVAFLPLQDRYADPEGMAVYGAINSTLDEDDILDASNSDDVSVLGSTDNFRRRNVLNAYLTRLVLGQGSPAGGELDETGIVSGDVAELMGGNLYYAEGDVTVSGSFSGTLAVRGGDVYIDADIDEAPGSVGILVFGDDGEGGNVYVAPNVTTLTASLFLDGSLHSYDGNPDSIGTDGLMDWDAASDDGDGDSYRLLTLNKQLYLLGSLVSRNTVGGAPDDEDCSAECQLGDGTTTTDFDEAREYDLNLIRRYRLCYPMDGDGNVVQDDTQKEVCDLADTGLSSYGEDAEEYGSFVIEFAPVDTAPVFVMDAGR